MSIRAHTALTGAVLVLSVFAAAQAFADDIPPLPKFERKLRGSIPLIQNGTAEDYAALRSQWADWLRAHSDYSAVMTESSVWDLQFHQREISEAEGLAGKGNYKEAVRRYIMATGHARHEYEYHVTMKYFRYFESKFWQVWIAIWRGDRYTAECVLPDFKNFAPLFYREFEWRIARMPQPDLSKLSGDVTLEFVTIPAGKFIMGSDHNAPSRLKSGDGWKWAYPKPPPKGEMVWQAPPHEVTFTEPFLMSKYEVTQKQWGQIMPFNPSLYKHPDAPVTNVSWEDCQLFLRLLRARRTDLGYRLPTEAEWEYACRAGTTTDYFFADPAEWSDYIQEETPLTRSHRLAVAPVGRAKPNPWGLYDMYGNASEWCENWVYAYPGNDKLLAHLVKNHPGIAYDAPRNPNILYDGLRPGILRGGFCEACGDFEAAWGGSAGRMEQWRWLSWPWTGFRIVARACEPEKR